MATAMTAPHNPPFRAEHVGSFLRPPALLQARETHDAGKLSAQQLRSLEDDAIKSVVALQESLGLQSITDGEFRRSAWFDGFIGPALGPIKVGRGSITDGYFVDEAGDKLPLVLVDVTGRISWQKPVYAAHFQFIQSLTARTPKVTIPSPTYFHFRSGRAHIDQAVYPDLDLFWEDIVAAYHKELHALADAGCRYVQFDDPPIAFLCDREQVWDQMRRRGDDPQKLLLETYPELINRCLEGRPAGLQVSHHLCRGNGRSHWGAEGGYEPLAETLFNQINADSYFLEYDTPRAGSFEPLRFVPKNKTVVLGLVSTKFPQLESKDSIKRRIDEACKFIGLDQLALSPQCGFASAMAGNLITAAQQESKLRLVVEVAQEVWG